MEIMICDMKRNNYFWKCKKETKRLLNSQITDLILSIDELIKELEEWLWV